MATERRDRDPDGRSNEVRSDGDRYEAHLERSRRVWDRWSDRYKMSERDFEPIRMAAIDRLALEPGDRVLEIGCGPGVNFERVRSEVGDEGEVIAVDYSPEMVEKARERIGHYDWENVEVRCADAATVAFDEPFDAALATLSMSVMPDAERTAANVYRSLAPGSRFLAFDIGPFQTGPARLANPLVRRFLRWYANWNPDDDVVDSLSTVFDDCAVVERYAAGAGYTVLCEKEPLSTTASRRRDRTSNTSESRSDE
ncbi:class I SAM-dependent methyltransferase [Halosolutus gelatinilyticus]|uniref:class I SAM-dependent methyltransferase n=1 Tax=Halosolutus gelatinilyticus TaxID=2931975 RepID=UPI001FF21041|nr:class I SAM-dependent methyltransferase [Halosolutus gelatinilyticus]